MNFRNASAAAAVAAVLLMAAITAPNMAFAAASATELAAAMGLDASEVSSSDLGTSSQNGVAVMTTPVGGFPSEGDSFAVLSSGCADDVLQANDEPNHSCLLDGLNTADDEDLVQLKLVLNVPANSTSVSFDWKFYSEEYPEFVGSAFNDAFLAETGNSTFTLSGANITAPNNVAFDQNGDLISINTSGFLAMSAAEANSTTYDGATPKLNTVAPVPAGASTFTLIFSVFDMGDSIFDTTVFIDNVKFDTAAAPTTPSTKKASDLDGVVPANATVNSVVNATAKLLDGTTGGPIANATIKWSMEPSGPSTDSTTNNSGDTQTSLDLAGLAPGNYTVKVVFEGNAEFQMDSFEKPLKITGEGQQPPPAENRPPVAVDDTATAVANSTKVIDVLANDSDPDGDNLLILSVTQPANGTSNKSSDGKTVSYQSEPGFAGTDSFDYTISDGKGANATAKVTVNVNATAPPTPPQPPKPPADGDDNEKNMFCGRSEDDFDNVKFGTNESETIWGTDKDDLIRGWGGNDTIYGMDGNDCLKGDDGDDTIWGGEGHDGVRGGDGQDKLYGDGGNDIVNGHAGDDTAWGGDGKDTLLGEMGNDRLIGDAGGDTIWGGDGDDKILGEDGNDVAYGDAGNDKVFGQADHDNLWGGGDDDLVAGGDGRDALMGDAGNDRMWGGIGNDTLIGGDGMDRLVGDAGNDNLQGENNDDVLLGEQGNDAHDGGAGTDKCYDVEGTNTVVNCETDMPAAVSDMVAQLKNATSKYQDPAAAAADGYMPTDACVPGMGYHYVDVSLASDIAATELEPEVILYAPGENGTKKLAGVEYFVAALANTSEGPKPWFEGHTPPMGWNNTAPVLFEGQTFYGPMPGHEPGMPWHYDLHAWVWKDNPDGTFATLNPQVSCSS